MAIMSLAKFHSNWLMLSLIFGIWASEPPGPGERLKRPGLIGLKSRQTVHISLQLDFNRYMITFKVYMTRRFLFLLMKECQNLGKLALTVFFIFL